jgi:NAD(P)H-hydrate epimerase
MRPILTPAEMAEIDAAAAEPVEVLIERAGAAVARAALRETGGAYGRHVIVVAGKGNNGADGRAAARRLRQRGVRVDVIDAADAPVLLPACDLVIDAAYGTGFHGDYRAPEPSGARVLAVDIPSGVDGLTGAINGTVMRAARTVTFAALKPGLVLEPGQSASGVVEVVDIGLDVSVARAAEVERDDVAGWLLPRPVDAHKWQSAVLVVAGSPGMTGAAALVAGGAQRAGAGMVRVAAPGGAADSRLPVEAVSVAVPASDWAAEVLGQTERFRALVVGPGLGVGDATTTAVRELVRGAAIPAVVDADALTALGTDAPAILRERRAPTVITPHDGEFARLTGSAPAPDRFESARSLAQSTGAVVVLKGATPLIANPDGTVHAVTTGDQRLATAGTGDVLSGITGALLARGIPAFEAASAAVWLFGRAAEHGHPHGFVSSDLLRTLPAARDEVEP